MTKTMTITKTPTARDCLVELAKQKGVKGTATKDMKQLLKEVTKKVTTPLEKPKPKPKPKAKPKPKDIVAILTPLEMVALLRKRREKKKK
tara:strand:- start:95 stop:364 length:270 start_codon:yes stop_codon:yes gene_type:complete